MVRQVFIALSVVLISTDKSRAELLPPPPSEPSQEEVLKALKRDRLKDVDAVYGQKWKEFQSGKNVSLVELFFWLERFRDAELAMAEKPLERLGPLENNLRRSLSIWELVKDKKAAGAATQADVDAARYYCDDGQIRVKEMQIQLAKLGIKTPKDETPPTPSPVKDSPPAKK